MFMRFNEGIVVGRVSTMQLVIRHRAIRHVREKGPVVLVHANGAPMKRHYDQRSQKIALKRYNDFNLFHVKSLEVVFCPN